VGRDSFSDAVSVLTNSLGLLLCSFSLLLGLSSLTPISRTHERAACVRYISTCATLVARTPHLSRTFSHPLRLLPLSSEMSQPPSHFGSIASAPSALLACPTPPPVSLISLFSLGLPCCVPRVRLISLLISLRLGLLRAPCPHCYLLLVCFFGMFPFFYLVISTSPCSSVLCSRLTHICASLFYFPLSAWASCPFRRITFTSVHHDLQATRS
jgi:hypothetical protein